jgi:hypothetical protein
VLGTGGLGHAWVRRRYTILFYSLLATIVATPASAALGIGAGMIEFFLAANLVLAVIPVGPERGRPVLLAVCTIILAAKLALTWLDDRVLAVLTLGTWTIIGLVAAAVALRFAMRAMLVNAEHLYAALSAYLLAGVFMGLFYWVLEQMWPSSFSVTGDFSRASAIYFSFVTLATIGYGDIVPRSDVARALAVLEGVGGQLFLAVLVARMLSAYGRGKDAAG